MKKGVFYSVGVGPGDPELITLKAVRTLERCPVVAAPQTKNGEMLALSIAQQAVSLEGKTVVPLHFTMSRDKAQQHAAHLAAALERRGLLERSALVSNCGLPGEQVYADLSAFPREQDAGYFATIIVKED